MELQALQSLLGSNPNNTNTNTESLFQELLTEVLASQSSGNNTMQSLGSLWSSRTSTSQTLFDPKSNVTSPT
jgi:hypothetical protein